MGKGDIRTKRGKIFNHSYGKYRKWNSKKILLKLVETQNPQILSRSNSISLNQKSNNMSILIDKVRIKNFRSLKDVEVNLQPVTLLVGANNAGKTTFLRALNIVFGVNKTQITRDDLFIDKDSNQPENAIIIDIRIIPINDKGKRVNEFDSQWTSIFGSDSKSDDIGEFFSFRTRIDFLNEGDRYESNQYFLTDWRSPNPSEDDKLTSSVFKAVLLYFIDAQRDLIDDTRLRTSYFGKLATQLDKDYKKEDLDEMTSLVQDLNDKAVEKSTVLRHLKTKLSELNQTTQTTGEGVSISPFPKKIRDLHKGMKVDYQDSGSDTFSMEYHGMGTRSWASILSFGAFSSWESDIKAAKSEQYFPILALEEPEAHLHPNAQRTLYRQLKSMSGQKIISTHSPYIAGQAELEELRHFYKIGDEAEITQIDLRLLREEDYPKVRHYLESSKGEILFSNIVVMCEGDTEEVLLPIFAKHYWGMSDFELGISFIKTGKYYPLLFLLRFLKIEWFIFSDYDKPDVKSALQNVLRQNGIITLENVVKLNDETTEKDIEEYLFDNGYDVELRNALKRLREPNYANERHRLAKQADVEAENQRIDALSKEDFIKELDNWKAKAASIYANSILQRTDETKRFPSKIQELFSKISYKIGVTKHETGTV